MYNHETGKKLLNSQGQPYPRPKGGKGPPCMTSPKACPKVSPTAGVELNETNKQAYQHYLECKAVGDFPDDPIVRQNAGIIRQIEDSHQLLVQIKLANLRAR